MTYYFPYKKVNEYGKQEEALIMVPLKGRRQMCYHCHSTEHWPNQCSNSMSQRTERTLGWRVEPAPGNVVTGISYARMAGTKRSVHQAAPPRATKAPPAATTFKAPHAATTAKAPPAAAATKPATEKASPPSKAGSPPKPASDSPASPPPAKGEKERKEEPVEIPAERKDKALSPKKKKKTTTAEIMKEELCNRHSAFAFPTIFW